MKTKSGSDFSEALQKARESLGVKEMFDVENARLTDTQKSIRGKNNYKPEAPNHGEGVPYPAHKPNDLPATPFEWDE